MYKNIIFDFGDVFINLDKSATARMLIRSGFAGITPDLLELFAQYETGGITTDNFIKKARTWVPKATDDELRLAWNAMILDFPDYRLHFAEQLAKEGTYRMFLLSNTNELHIQQVLRHMGDERYHRFMNCFEKTYYSHEIRLRKPDEAIFNFLLEENSLLAQETFFIDDTEEHIRTAAALGIGTWHLQVGKEDIVDLLSRMRDD